MTTKVSRWFVFSSIRCSFINKFYKSIWAGKPIGANLSAHYLTIFTLNGFVKIYDVSRHEPKMITIPKSCYDLFTNFGEVIMAKCNANGTLVAITIAAESLVPDGKLYVWNIERDTVAHYDFFNKNDNSSEAKEAPR